MKVKYKPSLISKIGFKKEYNINDSNIKEIDYYELILRLEKQENFHLVVGGSWCPNCLAFYPALDKFAKLENLEVLSFDPRIGYKHKRKTDIRACKTKVQELHMQELTKLLNLDLPIRVNNTYQMRVPLYVNIKNGRVVGSWSKEYFPHQMNEALTSEVIKELKELE